MNTTDNFQCSFPSQDTTEFEAITMSLHQCPRRAATLATSTPLYDFLVPRLHQTRYISTTPRRRSPAPINKHGEETEAAAKAATIKSGTEAAFNPAPRNKPLTKAQRDFLTSAVGFSPQFPEIYLILTPPSSASTKPASSPPARSIQRRPPLSSLGTRISAP